jgi:hypothetical protein
MRLGDANFLNLFSRIATRSNPDRDCDEWRVAGVDWGRNRSAHWAANVSFQIETHTLRHASRPAWVLLFVHELWWGQDREKAIRNVHWVRLHSGNRKDVLRWFVEHEREMDGK